MSLSFSSYSFKYPRSDEVNLIDINLKVKKGERVCVLGATGSGKSTLFMSMNGVIPHVLKGKIEGEVVTDGINIAESHPMELSHHISVVYADPTLGTVAMTVEDDVAFGPQCLGLKREVTAERVKKSLDQVGLFGFEKRSINTLSGGELQLTSIAAALSMRAPILALDEPLAMLDPIGKDLVTGALKSISETGGNTILLSEAGGDIEYIAPRVDRIIVIHEGRIIKDDSTLDVLSDAELLREVGIDPPQVTVLAAMLDGPSPRPISFEEAVPYFRKLLKKKGITKIKAPEKKVQYKPKGEPIISIRNLHHVFIGAKPVHALAGVSEDIYPGEFIGLIGQNGSGKSTLSQHLVGVYRPTDEEGHTTIPDETEIVVDGINFTELMRRGMFAVQDIVTNINYVFQNPDTMLFAETVEEEVGYGPLHLGFSEEEIKERVDDAFELYDLEKHREDPTIFLTRDLKTYVTAASVIAMRPNVIIIDEPTTGLDYDSSIRVMESLTKLQKRGHTIIIITHNMALVSKYTKRCIVLGKGKIFMDGPTRQVFSHPEVLQKVNILPPQITQLAQELGDLGFPPDIMTVEEMHEMIKTNENEQKKRKRS
jgi:energy-coupling factor transport system ATP-binding protein